MISSTAAFSTQRFIEPTARQLSGQFFETFAEVVSGTSTPKEEKPKKGKKK